MNGNKGVVLPYRTTGEEMTRFLEARARGRDLSQIQALDFSTGAFQGTLVAATALGFLDPDTRELTQVGRDYVLASLRERAGLVRGAMGRFEPYGLLLEAVFDRGAPNETPLDWVVNWWGTQGYGNSETNRDEGSSAFARLVEFTGLGSFVPGRRGHPTRIRWAQGAPGDPKRRTRASSAQVVPQRNQDDEAPPAAPVLEHQREPEALPAPTSAPGSARARPAPAVSATEAEPNSSLVLSLGPGRTVQLTVPPRITTAEKKRLLALIELIITPAPGD
jgi:hypothetical protein